MSNFLRKFTDALYLRSRLSLLLCLVLTCLLVLAVYAVAAQMVPVTLYKASLPFLGGIIGYALDRVFFPFAEPSSHLKTDWRKDPNADRPDEADYPVADGCELLERDEHERNGGVDVAT